jgi:hypothetical protein
MTRRLELPLERCDVGYSETVAFPRYEEAKMNARHTLEKAAPKIYTRNGFQASTPEDERRLLALAYRMGVMDGRSYL